MYGHRRHGVGILYGFVHAMIIFCAFVIGCTISFISDPWPWIRDGGCWFALIILFSVLAIRSKR